MKPRKWITRKSRIITTTEYIEILQNRKIYLGCSKNFDSESIIILDCRKKRICYIDRIPKDRLPTLMTIYINCNMEPKDGL
jgi:hypothetical protein